MNLFDVLITATGTSPVERNGERWLPVTDFPHYWISDHGRLINLRTLRILHGSVNPKGNRQAKLTDGTRIRTAELQRLVATAFLPGTPTLTRHIDGNRLNNHINNLRWTENTSEKAAA